MKIVTLGEIMLRLSTPMNQRFVQATSFDVCYGGGEANVAVSLANYGHQAYFVSKLPTHEIGQAAIDALRKYGVNTSYIVRGGERLGIYYLESGAAMRPSKVIYDRAHSAIAEASVEDFNFDAIFQDVDWFHFTGITPALGAKATKIIEQALITAKKHHVMVSCDLNYRKKLWSSAQAIETMSKLMKYVDICIGNEEDAEKCLGFKVSGNDVEKGQVKGSNYLEIFEQIKAKFGFKYIATSLRTSHSASDNGWSGILYDGEKIVQSKTYDIHIVDRVGGGDAFASGMIHGLLTYPENVSKALDFAVATSALKHTIPGDFNHVSIEEVTALMQGDASGRVQR